MSLVSVEGLKHATFIANANYVQFARLPDSYFKYDTETDKIIATDTFLVVDENDILPGTDFWTKDPGWGDEIPMHGSDDIIIKFFSDEYNGEKLMSYQLKKGEGDYEKSGVYLHPDIFRQYVPTYIGLVYSDILQKAVWYELYKDPSTNEYYYSVGFSFGLIDQSTLYSWIKNAVSDSDDPYAPGGTSDDGGGEGSFTIEDDGIDIPSLPSIDICDTGMITIYNPSIQQIKNLANYLWTSDFFDNIKKLWVDPMNVILGLNIIPFSLTVTELVAVQAGNVNTGIFMPKVTSQWKEIDCGSLNVGEFYGGYMDWAPYTKLSIYLPYIGTRQLSTDDIMGNTITLKYHCDVVTGSCIAYIKCGNKVLYQFSGNCSTTIPLTAQNMAQVYAAAVNVATSLGTAVATGGATLPAMASTMLNAAGSKPEIQKSGSSSSTNGILGIQRPYLIRERPHQCTPDSQNKYTGYPSFVTRKMKTLKKKGFTKIDNIRLIGFDCTTDEKNEILSLMKEGVIFR